MPASLVAVWEDDPIAGGEDGVGKDRHLPSVRMGRWALTIMPTEIDMANAQDLGQDLKTLLDRDGTVLVVDMTQTGFCDSAGIRMLVLTHRQAAERGSQLRLVAPSACVCRVLELSGADQVLRVFTTMNEALVGAPTGLHTAGDQDRAAES